MAEFSRKDIVASFGLISTTVRLTGAVERENTSLTTLCVGDEKGSAHTPVQPKQKYYCPECDMVLEDRALLKKGHSHGDGFVLVDPDEVRQARDETAEQYKKSVKFTAHPAGEVLERTAPNGTLYYLQPQTAAAVEAYALLRDLIARNPDRAFVALYTVTSRIGMYVARVHGDTIVLEGRHRVTELRETPEIPEAPENEALAGMAQQFLESMVDEFDPDTYKDTYAERLQEMLQLGTVVATSSDDVQASAQTGADLMALLQAELDK